MNFLDEIEIDSIAAEKIISATAKIASTSACASDGPCTLDVLPPLPKVPPRSTGALIDKDVWFLRLCKARRFVGFSFDRITTEIENKKLRKNPHGMPARSDGQITKDNFASFIKYGDQAFAVMTGEISNVTVIDCDNMGSYESLVADYPELRNTFSVRTAQGVHVYCTYVAGVVGNTHSFNSYPNVDIRNDSEVVFAPPTVYMNCLTNGKSDYKVIDKRASIKEFPAGLLADLKEYRSPATQKQTKSEQDVTVDHDAFEGCEDEAEGDSIEDPVEGCEDQTVDSDDLAFFAANEHAALEAEMRDLLLNRLDVKYIDNRSDWIKFGAAIHWELRDTPSSRQLFLEYSRRAERFKSIQWSEIEKDWRSFVRGANKPRSNGPSTIGTLRYVCNRDDALRGRQCDGVIAPVQPIGSAPEHPVVNSTALERTFDFALTDITHTSLSRFFVACYGHLFLQTSDQRLYYWGGDVWETDTIAKQMMLQLLQTSFYDELLKQGGQRVQAKLTKQLQQHSNYTSISKGVLTFLPLRKDVCFDTNRDQFNNLHFRNGVLMLNKVRLDDNHPHRVVCNEAFRPRVKEDYMTKTLDWDFQFAVDDAKLARVKAIFRQMQPDPIESRFQLAWLAYCLTGHTGEHKQKFNIGYTAANGKTTEALIHRMCFKMYSLKLPKNTFAADNQKAHKFLIDLIEHPIRYAYIEELDRRKIDEELMNEWIDGKDQKVEVLFATTFEATSQAKFSSGSNKDPNAEGQQGFMRRGLLQHYHSRFVKKNANPAEHVYPRIDNLEDEFIDVAAKRAYLEMLLPHLVDYYANGLFIPETAEKAFADVMESYDEFKTAVYALFEAGGADDRVAKDDFVDALKRELGSKITWAVDVLPKLRRIGLSYDKERRAMRNDGVSLKGAVMGLRQPDVFKNTVFEYCEAADDGCIVASEIVELLQNERNASLDLGAVQKEMRRIGFVFVGDREAPLRATPESLKRGVFVGLKWCES